MNIQASVSAAVGGIGAVIGLMQSVSTVSTSPAVLAVTGGAAGWLISWGMIKATVRSQDQRMNRWEQTAGERHTETNGKLDKLSSEVGQVRDRVSRIEGQLSRDGD